MDFKINMELTVKKKLFLGFGVVILLMLAVTLNSFFSVRKVGIIEDRLLNLRFPTVLAGTQLENGINLSLAGLRGYMILGKDPQKGAAMKKSRMAGWNEIDDAMNKMRGFSESWTNPQNIEKLKQLEVYVEEFRAAQQEIENISHTVDEIPAFKTLVTNAAPRAARVLAAITAMINQEANLEATPERKRLLKLMADSRGSFALGLANIRAYLLTGDVKFRDNFNARWDVNEARFKQILAMSRLLTASQRKAWNDYKTIRAEFSEFPPLMFKQRSSEAWNQANYLLGTKAAPKAKAIMEILDGMRINQSKLKEVDAGLLKDESNAMQITLLIGTIIGVIVGVFVAIVLSRAIVVPLQRVVSRAKEIASGDLTGNAIEAKGNDELTELINAINEMTVNLQDIIQQVSGSAKELSVASSQLQTTAEETNQGMENQRAETEHVATAMNEMSATVQEIARHASMAATAANEADGAAAHGHRMISDNMQSITTLAEGIEKAAVVINKLGEDTNSVDSIVAVINDIARQTNLLALNATVEAARAGEQGKSFSVVADEVRLLAARTQQSTKEIRTRLDGLKVCANDAVQAMSEGHKQAQQSVKQANTVSSSITDITRAITSIGQMNSQIAAATEEQSTVAEEMNRSVAKISGESELALQHTQETSSAAVQVGALSLVQQDTVSRFKL